MNFGAHAIHGVGFGAPWTVTRHDSDLIELELALPSDTRWPFGGTARQRIRRRRFDCAVRAGGDRRRAGDACLARMAPVVPQAERLDFHPEAMYRRDDEHIAVDELVDVPPGPWDDCFVNTVAGRR